MPESTKAFVASLNKLFGEGTVVSAEELVIPRRYTSGSLALDVILGGGFPGNLWTEILGMESSGKTFTLFRMVAANQRLDPAFATLWVAAEHFDSEQAEALGVDVTRVDVVRTQDMEIAFEAMVRATSSHEYDCVILDSYPALSTEDELEKGMDEFTVGSGAKRMNQFTRKAGAASRRNADGSDRPFFGIIVNQWRDKPGGFQKFAPARTSPGGKGKNYFFYCRLDLVRIEYLKEKRPGIADPVKVGQTIKYLTFKNKSAAPQQVATVDVYFRAAPFLGFKRGDIDMAKEYVEVGIALGVIGKRGGWYYFGSAKWNGEPKLKEAVRTDPDLRARLQAQVLELASDPKALAQREQEATDE
jgi:recombination protein RecA